MTSFRGVVKAKMNQSMSRFHLNTVAPFETDSKQQKELVFRQALAAENEPAVRRVFFHGSAKCCLGLLGEPVDLTEDDDLELLLPRIQGSELE